MKCITFDKKEQDSLTEHIRAKMKQHRDSARIEAFCQYMCGISAISCSIGKSDLCADLRNYKNTL